MDKANVDAQMQKEVVDQIYDCTDSFIDSSSDKVVKAADGKGYAVNLKDSRLLKDNGIYCDDLYILIRRNYKDDEKNTQAHDDFNRRCRGTCKINHTKEGFIGSRQTRN